MGINALRHEERDIIRQCLSAAVVGPFFPDWEFHTLFGIARSQVAEILARWPDVDESQEEVQLARFSHHVARRSA